LVTHLASRWRDLFNVDFDVLLYDLTSTYFEINAADVPEGNKRRHGYSRDKRPDCSLVVIALVVTPDGLPLAHEVLPVTWRIVRRYGCSSIKSSSNTAARGGSGLWIEAFRPKPCSPRHGHYRTRRGLIAGLALR
jgi:hypothetical protein